MQQFFIDSIDDIVFSQGQIHQMKQVLKLRQGDSVRLVDTNGNGIIATFTSSSLDTLDIKSPITFYEKRYRLRIVAALIRSEPLEWMIQKACECGVDEIFLYRADRGVVRDFGKREDRKLERFNLIAKEASEQAYRQYPVPVHGFLDLKDLHTTLSETNIYGDTTQHPYLLDNIHDRCGTISVYIGPEGGFSNRERTLFESLNIQPVSFGPMIYRAETAPLAVATMISTLENRNYVKKDS